MPCCRRVALRAGDRNIEPRGPSVSFERLVRAVAEEYGLAKEAMVRTGRQRSWVQARRQLVYLAREWANMTTQELGKRLRRDSSMISRLYRDYEENRDQGKEAKLAQALSQ